MLTPRARRGGRSEQGQVLAAALILVFFFALLSVSTFQLASVTQVQHSQAAASAASHWPTDGAGLYAYVDGTRADQPAVCVAGSGGDITFHNSVLGTTDKLTYTIDPSGGCNVGGHATGSGNPPPSGSNCALCIMGTGSAPLALSRSTTITGEVDVNGSAAAGNVICSNKSGDPNPLCDGSGFIGIHDLSHSSGTYDPAAVAIPTFADPLEGAYPLPSASLGTGTTNSHGVAQPGVWSTLTGNIASGTYIVTGKVNAIIVTDSLGVAIPIAQLANAPVTLFLECPNGASWKVCAPGDTGATIDAKQDTISLDAPSSGLYDNLAIFADPNNTNTIDYSQGELDVGGTIEAPGMSVSVHGSGSNNNAGVDVTNGRLIISALSFQGSVHSNGVSVGGSVPVTALTNCNVYSDKLSATTPGAIQGRTVVQTSLCGGNAIVSFDYSP